MSCQGPAAGITRKVLAGGPGCRVRGCLPGSPSLFLEPRAFSTWTPKTDFSFAYK